MSTSVYYKGSKLIDVNNNTKTLLTSGKYLEGDVILTDNTLVPSGTSNITSNGIYDITSFATASVSVAGSSSNDFIVTLSQNAYGSLTIDKTFSEIISAFSASKKIAAYGDGSPYYTGDIYVNERFEYVDVIGYSVSGDDLSTVLCGDFYTFGSDYSVFQGAYYYYEPHTMNATPSDVLSGKRFVNESGFQVGTATGGGGFTADEIAMRTISGDISGSATSIGSYAFRGCSALTTASFPNVTNISSYAFYDCRSLTTAYFPSATDISGSAFTSCRLLTTISFPNATSIGGYAFRECSALTTASFPNATYIGSNAFQYCSSLTTASFPSVSFISNYAFASCRLLTTISFPNATYIGSNAFAYCHSLTIASFPSVSFISNYAFAYCRSLTTASFPNATTINSCAFTYCRNLLSFYLLGSSVPTLGTDVFSSTPIDGYTDSTAGVYGSVFVPSSLYDQYIVATNWSLYSDRIVSV